MRKEDCKKKISLGVVQDRRKKRKKRSGGQGWKEWERETVPSWMGSKHTAWWSERPRETVGERESDTQRGKGKTEGETGEINEYETIRETKKEKK